MERKRWRGENYKEEIEEDGKIYRVPTPHTLTDKVKEKIRKREFI